MTETTCTLTGNLTADPELRFTPSGAAVANFTVAAACRTLDKTTNQWRDGQALFMRCTLWRQPAENLAESLRRADRVIVTGHLRQRSFETREGDKRTAIELDVEDIGASLKFTTRTLTKTDRGTTHTPAGEQTADDEPPFRSARPGRLAATGVRGPGGRTTSPKSQPENGIEWRTFRFSGVGITVRRVPSTSATCSAAVVRTPMNVDER